MFLICFPKYFLVTEVVRHIPEVGDNCYNAAQPGESLVLCVTHICQGNILHFMAEFVGGRLSRVGHSLSLPQVTIWIMSYGGKHKNGGGRKALH